MSIIYVKCLNENQTIGDFFGELHKHQYFNRNFLVARFNETSVKDTLRDYIVEHGISSLFHFTITCDSVLHQGIHVDDIEKVVLGFIRKLAGVKDLLVIDPYLYSTDPGCVELFGRMMGELSQSLRRVVFITNGRAHSRREAMHEALRGITPTVDIKDVVSDQFHDRYWIDSAANTGIVMGTSLNGIGKKIALIDLLSSNDVKDIVALAYQLVESAASPNLSP